MGTCWCGAFEEYLWWNLQEVDDPDSYEVLKICLIECIEIFGIDTLCHHLYERISFSFGDGCCYFGSHAENILKSLMRWLIHLEQWNRLHRMINFCFEHKEKVLASTPEPRLFVDFMKNPRDRKYLKLVIQHHPETIRAPINENELN